MALPVGDDPRLVVCSDSMIERRGLERRGLDRRSGVALDSFRRLVRNVMATCDDSAVAAERLSSLGSGPIGQAPRPPTTVMVIDL